MPYSTMTFRKYIEPSSWIATRVRKANCWHFDAWLYLDPHGRLWLRVLTHAGGTKELLAVWAHVDRWATGPWSLSPVDELSALPDVRECTEVTLGTRASAAIGEAQLNALHWNEVYRIANNPPAGYLTTSIALHYLKPRADWAIPFDGADNFWRYNSSAMVNLRYARAVKAAKARGHEVFKSYAEMAEYGSPPDGIVLPPPDADRPLAHLEGLL